MRVGLDTAITVNFILLLTGWPGISTANILTDIPKNNPLNIDWDPAPSPEDGPPLSAGALRNPAYLPAEIGGIVGAYLLSVCIVGIAIILLGRKLRRQVSQSLRVLDIEMVEPPFQAYHNCPTPVNPGGHPASPRNFSWPSPEKTDRNPYVFPTTGGQTSPHGADPFVDRRIVEADQEMLQRDLEDIYAHVMEQEEAKAAGVKVAEMPPPPPLQSASPPPPRSTTPKKIEKSRPSNLTIEEPKSKPQSRASSIISSLKSPKRRGIRGMMISSPVPTPLSATFPSPAYASDEEPLSPRYYAPPPPPPVPKDQVQYTHVQKNSQGSPVSPTKSIAEQLSPYGAQQYHRLNPSQTSMHSRDPASASSATSQTPLFPAQSLRQPPYPNKSTSTVNLPPSNNSSVRQLPLRQFEPAMQSPSFAYTTKTTVLERSNPLSSGLTTGGGPRTPWSAGAVPYSPYQPFTPMVPITPRLVTKEDRKAMKKMEGRTPTLEMIKSDDELFDSAY